MLLPGGRATAWPDGIVRLISAPLVSAGEAELAYAIHIEVWPDGPGTYGVAAYEVEVMSDEPEIPQDSPEPTGLERLGFPN